MYLRPVFIIKWNPKMFNHFFKIQITCSLHRSITMLRFLLVYRRYSHNSPMLIGIPQNVGRTYLRQISTVSHQRHQIFSQDHSQSQDI